MADREPGSAAADLPPYDHDAAMRLLDAINDPDWEIKRMDLVTLSPDQRPIPAVSADDPLVRSVAAYTARMRAEAVRLRDLADKYDALADNSDPVPVVVVGG